MPVEMQYDPDLAAIVDRFRHSPVEVAEKPSRLRPIVKHTRDCLLAAAKKAAGEPLIWAKSREPVLSVGVGPDSIDRAVRILDALVRGLELAGFTVNGPTVSGLGIKRVIRLREKTRQVPHKIKPGAGKLDPLWSPKFDYIPNGILGVEIGNPFNAWSTRDSVWETKTAPLESGINSVIFHFLMEAQWSRNQEAAKAEAEKRRVEAETAERERRERVERRRRREEALFQKAERWRRVETLRGFLEAVRRTGGDDPKTAKWLAWAERVAARGDPLRRMKRSSLERLR